MRIEWTTSTTANTLHAAAWLAAGERHVDVPVADALGEAVLAAEATLDGGGLLGSTAVWLSRAASLAASGLEGADPLAQRLVARHVGPSATPSMTATLSAVLASTLSAGARYLAKRPRSLAEEIALRRGPLVEQWTARGPGLLKAMARRSDPMLFVESARVSLVLPAAGGHGLADPPTNSVRLEAVLANPHSELPEVVRLAWLLAQLNADLPPLVEHAQAGRASELTALAMVPIALSAAADVELSIAGVDGLEQALEAWRLPTQHAAALRQWWDTYNSRQVEWRVAIAALGEMIPEGRPGDPPSTA